ncbi:hypothetical protein [Streptomyces sp. NPDC087300]|uniref:hypothetical protein n=1 Tax=Streptomyces sp. NPDC087300 TaxID=3365780 RepID=UPI0038241FBD
MSEIAESAGRAGDGIWMLYCGAVFIILMGALFAFNAYGVSERFFRLVTTYVPTGRATPRTMRVVGVGWIAVGILMLSPEIIQAIRMH